MEMSRRYKIPSLLGRIACCLLFLLLIGGAAQAQPVMKYTVKDGKMFISLGKDLPEKELQEFIKQFDLHNLSLDQFLRNGFDDSLRRAGWKIEFDNRVGVMISKALATFEDINNPADRILLTGNHISFDALFPSVSNKIRFGVNRFRSNNRFAVKDTLVEFILREEKAARKVMLAGNFNNWDPQALSMQRTDSGWIAHLALKPGKYWYKFIVDGKWITDPDNRINENDGFGNTNSVYYQTNTVFRLDGYTGLKTVVLAGSFNDWDENQLLMERTATGWELPVYLADGTHRYRFIADKNWITDPSNPRKLPNEFGEFNSVVEIGKAHLFKLEGYTQAKQVMLTGSFNGWRRDELYMNKTASGWELPYVIGPGNYQYRFIVDGKSMTDPANPPEVNDDRSNSLLILEPNYTFHLKGYSSARKVYLAGDFNNWDPAALLMKKQEGGWVFPVHLAPGKHLYKFIVDGEWILDPDNKLWEENEHHTGNSVIWIDKK
jgi:Glycogen recognition site of AMP-activated protein kinase